MADLMVRAYRCFRENDVRLLEINPVIETPKVNFLPPMPWSFSTMTP